MDLNTSMDRLPVQSSTLVWVSYSTDRFLLESKFRDGGVYRFFQVPARCAEELLASDSKGTYFNQHIRNRFCYQRASESGFTDP